MLTAEQLEARKSGLGGSEVATILGLNPYKTSYQLWLEKTGRAEPEDISNRFAVKRGNDMEALVAKWFSEETGLTVHRVNSTLTNPDHPYMLGHIDRRVVGRKEGLECKTANWRVAMKFGESGTDDVPAYYLIQCMHYMIVTGWRVWHLAADLGGDFRIYQIEYDESLANHVAKAANDWWVAHIINDQQPMLTTGGDLDLAYPEAADVELEASREVARVHEELTTITNDMKALKERDKTLREELKAAMGEAAVLTYHGKPLATWKNQERKSFNSKAFSNDHPDLFSQYQTTNRFRVFLPKFTRS